MYCVFDICLRFIVIFISLLLMYFYDILWIYIYKSMIVNMRGKEKERKSLFEL